ncbi:hypothetical protein FHY55_04925 [Oceanicola sp. D3]|uniref:hypothetical protein n=1 Tax=Oceanicola sp. D3 TaxID=2587163 RepID=UPI00111FD09F|nr:hypothetical protein [Oceanicola sp. D3]QDC08623.1 hypothetical protein FHY55_04925 [Oceanicola sp. D3]
MDSKLEAAGGESPAPEQERADLVVTFGTDEPPVPWRRIALGPLSFLLSDQSIRRITWHGVELVRAISWPIRDENWATYAAVTLDEATAWSEGRITGRIEQSIDGGRLALTVEFSASEEGTLSVAVTMTPKGGAFATNRAGLTVLHPIRGLTGAPVTLTHPDGSSEDARFPELIKPSQPMKDIAGLAYGIGPAAVDMRFEGEVFEMEDQRNWSDASYKTYCVPLKEPFTYEIAEPQTQRASFSFSGSLLASTPQGGDTPPRVELLGRNAPDVGLVLEEGWLGGAPTLDATRLCGTSHLLLRIDATTSAAFLDEVFQLARTLAVEIDLELVLDDARPEAAIEALAARIATAGIVPRRVIALTEAYLKSYQPTATWPDGPPPSALVEMSRQAFPEALIGGGMLTNFTEFNRCPPEPELCDFVFHGNSATVHASDDLSVVETLEALPQVFRSAEALAGQAAYRLGLVSIGMRTNPYGAKVSDNPEQLRETMARPDPRHRGLFAAAWAVGVLASTGQSNVEALCLAAPTGPFGLAYTPQAHAQPGFDQGEGVVVPLFHVHREARRLAGAPGVMMAGLPEGVVAYGAKVEGQTRIMIANLSQVRRTVTLPEMSLALVLDRGSARSAMADSDWLRTAPRVPLQELSLAPYAVGFLSMGAQA